MIKQCALAGLSAAVLFAAFGPALAQNAPPQRPRPAAPPPPPVAPVPEVQPTPTLAGLIIEMHAPIAEVGDGNGVHRDVILHPGTIVKPSGMTLKAGMRINVYGSTNPRGTIDADEIDAVAGPPALPTPSGRPPR